MPPDHIEMTPEQENEFFQTGQLPSSILLSQEENAPAAPAATAEPAPAAKVEPQVEDAAGGGEPSVLERLLEEERQRARDLEARLAEASKPKAAAEPEAPDPITDPLGNIIHQLERSNREIASLKQQMAEKESQAALKAEFDQFRANVKAMKDEFAATTPDFDAAYKHVTSVRIADLMDLGYSRADAQQTIWQDELRLAQAALAKGKNPAEQMYAMAKRYGFAAQPAAAGKAAPAPQAAAEDKVTRLANGQFAAKPAGRAAANAELSLDGLKDASNADLNSVVLDDTMWSKVVGGKGSPDIFHH